MKTILKSAVILVVAVLSLSAANAQQAGKSEFRAFYGLYTYHERHTDIFSHALVNGILGHEKTEFTTFGMAGVGYRYHLDRFSVGLDLGYSSEKEEVFKKASDKKPSQTFKVRRYIVLPTASYSYYKKGILDFYGSASAGIEFNTRKQDNIKNAKTTTDKAFAYQVSPLGLRIGNETIGGFVELGYGYKGFVSAGISFKF